MDKNLGGISLLEILLWMLLVSTLGWFFLKHREHYRQDIELQRIQYNLQALQQAAQEYYLVTCRADVLFSMTVDQIQPWLTHWEVTPTISDYSISVTPIGINAREQPRYQLIIHLSLRAGINPDIYQTRLGVTLGNSQKLEWRGSLGDPQKDSWRQAAATRTRRHTHTDDPALLCAGQ